MSDSITVVNNTANPLQVQAGQNFLPPEFASGIFFAEVGPHQTGTIAVSGYPLYTLGIISMVNGQAGAPSIYNVPPNAKVTVTFTVEAGDS